MSMRHSPRTRKATADAAARLKARVVAVVAAIPEGRVTTYGLVARRLRVNPRQVARLREEGVAVTPRNKVADFAAVVWTPG